MTADILQIRDYAPKSESGFWDDEPAHIYILPILLVDRGRDPRTKTLLTLKQKMDALRKLQAAERGD